MNRMRHVVLVALGLIAGVGAVGAEGTEQPTFDLVVYGGTSAGLSAAVQARRMGLKNVVVLEPTSRIGGLSTGGLGQTDIGVKWAFGGIAREFYRGIRAHYNDPANWRWQARSDYRSKGQSQTADNEDTMWTFEPSAALAVLEGWEKRDGLDIRRGEWLDREKGGVTIEDGRITAIRTLSGKTYRGRMFVDATYEGDLMAAAGVSYAVGREANAVYGETINGVQSEWHPAGFPKEWDNQIHVPVDPYVVPGDRTSGLLRGVEAEDRETANGTGDRRVQAYCFRVCMTDCEANRIPFGKPASYDERNYEILFRMAEAGGDLTLNNFAPMPNRKTDSNNRGGFSMDFIGANWNYPEASYAERERIARAHLDYQRGLLWTLANHPRIPAATRAFYAKWGTCRDEFADGYGDGWQRQLYVREARRMVGDYVMTEHDCRQTRQVPRPVALAAYGMDSHNVRRHVVAGRVRNEGDVQDHKFKRPYPVEYGSIVPKKSECRNLFVPICVSASHIAYGSIRMEPVFFALGQVAGTAAALALSEDIAVQDVDYAKLLARLLQDGQVVSPVETCERTYDIRTFGALGGDRLDTAAIQKAVDAAWRAGGGEVVVPEGFFRTGGVRLRSNVTLHLLEGAVLEGSWNCEDYDVLERDLLEPVGNLPTNGMSRSACVTSRWNHALIRAYKAHNVAIIGERHSLIDGRNCYDAQGEEKYRGPHALSFWDCDGVTLRGYTIRNSANWAHIVVRCPGTRFENIVVHGGHDGLDIHCCTGTVVQSCRFYTGDDAIAGFGNVDTRVSDCVFCCSCNDVRFGGTDALFERCRSIRPAPWGHRYSLSAVDKASARNHGESLRHDGNLFTYYCDNRWGPLPKPGNIVFRDCQFDGVNRPCVVDWGSRWGRFIPLEDVAFENCRFTNLRQGFKLNACPQAPITVSVRGSTFEAAPEARGMPFVEGAHCTFADLDATRVHGFRLSAP